MDIPTGTSTAGIADAARGGRRGPRPVTFRVALWVSGQARRLQAGEYRFDRPMTAREVIDKIARGDVDVSAVTFPRRV